MDAKEMVERLLMHIRMMPAHQREREAGKLLIESRTMIEQQAAELEAAVEANNMKDVQLEALREEKDTCGSGAGCLHKDATIDALLAERDALALLLGDVASALEYHQEQTRPIHSTKVALDAYRAARAGGGK